MNLKRILLIILIILALLFIICYLFKCCDGRPKTVGPPIHDPDSMMVSRIPNQMIVGFPTGIDANKRKDALNKFKSQIQINFPKFDIWVSKTCPCDTLELWEANMDIVIQGQDGPAGAKNGTSGSGE